MEEDSTTGATVAPTIPEDAARLEEEVLWEGRMQEVEFKYATLQQSHMELQALCDEQQRTIDSLRQQQQQILVSTPSDKNESEEEASFQRALEKERSERLNMEELNKRTQERLDRVLSENDLLREELARLHQSNTHLSNQLQQIEIVSKVATSSQIPLRFRLERAEQGNKELSAQNQWLENEMVTLKEEYELKLQHKTDLLHMERRKVATMALEEAERYSNLQSLHQEKLQKLVAEHQQTLLNLQNDHSQLIQSLQEALLSEQHLNRLHQANQEEKQHKIDSLQRSLETMQSMVQSAEKEQQEIHSKLVEEHKSTLLQIQEQYAQEISNYQEQIESLQGQLRATEQRNIRRERRRALVGGGGAAAAAAAPLITDGTTVVVEEESPDAVVVPSLTELLDRLADTEDQLTDEIAERRRVELILEKTQLEIEARTPILRAQRRDYEHALQLQQEAHRQLEEVSAQNQRHLQLYEDALSENKHLRNQLKVLQRESQDLARQIQSLLRSRMGEENNRIDDVGNDDLIVEFESIEELQQQNQCLVRDHRQLTERVKNLEEQLDQDMLKKSLETAMQELEILREERNRQEVLVTGIVQQRDMFRELCSKTSSLLHESPPTDNITTASEEHRLQEECSKLQGNLLHAHNENQALQDQAKRLDAYAADVVASLNKVQGELLSAQSLCARSKAEADFFKDQCDRYKESLETAQSETRHIQNARMELQSIQSELERSSTQARADIMKLEQEAIRKNSQIRLLEGQLENAQQAEQRLLAEAESARLELSRQGALIETVHRIESSLMARNAEQQQQQQEEIDRQRRNMAQEVLRQATELERWQRTSEELEEKKRSAEEARDKALQEVLEAKRTAVDASQKLLDVQSKADSLKEKCDQLEHEVAAAKARLEAMSLSSTDKAKDATIENLSTELETVKSKLVGAKERVSLYQKIAKDNEVSLAELSSSYDTYKETMSSELEKLKKDLELSNKAAEAKQAALDDLSEELAAQRGRQTEEIDDLTRKNDLLTRELEDSRKDLDVTANKLTSVEEEINLHKANAFAARVSSERLSLLY
jgi:nucleoprotein TPR